MTTAEFLSIKTVVEIDRFALPLKFLFPDAELEKLRPFETYLAPHHIDYEAETVLLAIQSMLLRRGNKNILIDTCVGACKERPARPEWHQLSAKAYLGSLAAHGLTPDDIDIVFCTHLHADHMGWNTRLENGQWVPTFKNARYLVSETELDFWLAREAAAPGAANHGAFADSVLPVLEAGLIDRVSDGFSLGSGMSLINLPGHTVGQMGLEIARPGHPNVALVGDAIHSVAQVFFPEWSSPFCSHPDQGHKTRLNLIERSQQDGLIIVPSHIRGSMGFVMNGAHPDFLSRI